MSIDAEQIPEAIKECLELLQLGRLQDGEKLLRRVLAVDPDHADALHLLGVVALKCGHPLEAEQLISRAIGHKPAEPSFLLNLGNARHFQGKQVEAIEAFAACIELAPNIAAAHFNLGNSAREMGNVELAIKAYQRTVAIEPEHFVALNNLGSIIHQRDGAKDAEALLRQAVALGPDYPDAHFNLANVLWALGTLDEAVSVFRRVVTLDAKHSDAWANMGIVLLEQSSPREALEALDRALALDERCVKAMAARVAALGALGEREALNEFADVQRLIHTLEVQAPANYSDRGAFNAALSAHVLAHPSLRPDPPKHATRNGRHSGALLSGDKGPMADLERIIDSAVRDYIAAFSSAAPHPFVDHLPQQWKVDAWAVVMDAQGHQVAHTHNDAWISGVYYPQVPAAISDTDSAHNGWIEFGRPPPNYNCANPTTRLFRPHEGLMLLFPSYFWHGTIPFEGGDSRISIAFDIIRT